MYERYCILRDKKGIKDAQVARETRIPPSTFSDWKNGTSKPKIEKLQKLAAYFDVSLDWLMGIDEDNTPQMPNDQARLIAHNMQLAKAMEDPKVAEFAKLLDQLSDEDIEKVHELAELLIMKHNANK